MKYRTIDDAMRNIIAEMYGAGRRVPEIAAAVGMHEVSVYRGNQPGPDGRAGRAWPVRL